METRWLRKIAALIQVAMFLLLSAVCAHAQTGDIITVKGELTNAPLDRIYRDCAPNRDVRFTEPRIGEELALDSIVGVGDASELRLRVEQHGAKDSPLERTDRSYHKTIRGMTCLSLKEIVSDGSSSRSSVFVENFTGDVYVSREPEALIEQWFGKPIFESFSLHELYHYKLYGLSAEALKDRIRFRKPHNNEELAPYSFILVDEGSKLTLRLEPVNKEMHPLTSDLKQYLRRTFPNIGADPVSESSGKYYCAIAGGDAGILADYFFDNFLDNFKIFVDSYSGLVYLSTDVKEISEELSRGLKRPQGRVDSGCPESVERPAQLGIAIAFGPARRDEASIEQVFENSPAEKAGLEVNDVIVRVDGKQFADNNDFVRIMEGAKKAGKVTVKVRRDSRELDYTVILD